MSLPEQEFVLIETSWNVKHLFLNEIIVHFRINRNIVECKEDEIEETWRRLRVLIETSWNVKLEKLDLFLTLAPVLIETSWNVKMSLIWISRSSPFLY